MRNFEFLLHESRFDEVNNMVRWNGLNRIQDETVGHHSFIVSWITRILCENIFQDDKPKLECTTYAIFHDFNEFITGDINHNVKYNKLNGEQIRTKLDEYIKAYVDENFPTDNNTNSLLNQMLKDEIEPFVKKLVKVADWMSMLMYLRKEESLGNKTVQHKIGYCESMLHKAADYCIVELQNQKVYEVNVEILK